MDRKDVDRWADENEEELTLFADFDDAIIGVGRQFNTAIVVYSKGKIVEAIMHDGATHEEAIEHFDFNVAGSWIGEQTPLIMLDDDE